MRVALAVGLMALVLVPSAAPRGIPEGEVLYATWMVGGRFTREEWLERATGATHRRDTGGPACPRHVVSDRRWVLHYGCGYPLVYRVRGDADSRLVWETSDLLRPRRLLRLGRATIEGETTVDGVPAIRVRIRNRYGDHYADLDPRTRLPLQFVYGDDEWKLRYRSKRRASLPRNFFSPRR